MTAINSSNIPRSPEPSSPRSLLSSPLLSGVCNAGRFATFFATGV